MTTKADRAPKPKKCKTCATPFRPMSMTHVCCSVNCSVTFARAKREKAAAKKLREDKEKAKPRSKWLAEAQQVFNGWIRERDADLPCISCGRHHTGQNHAGHYFSVGSSPELRFNPSNVHKQCATCNTYLHGNLVHYRRGLIAKIGLEAVEALEGPHPPQHYSIDELKAIKADYSARTRALRKERDE